MNKNVDLGERLLEDHQDRGSWRVAFVSATILILELAFIRLVPAEVKAISYFTNLILMASFFGLGLGCILQRRRSLELSIPVGALLLLAFILVARGVVIYTEATAVHYWLLETSPTDSAPRLPLVPSAIVVFLLSAAPFVGLGQRLAQEMQRHSRLVAYSWDIAGSLAGTLIFTASSFLRLPPWVWLPVLMTGWAAVFRPRWTLRALLIVSGFAFLTLAAPEKESHWSPYYLVQHERESTGLRVWVNSSFHQYAIDFTATSPEGRALQDHMMVKWSLPYEVYRSSNGGRNPQSVLILGAGTGNDVIVALKNGVQEVVAVEIDPVILELGRNENPSRPYDDPRVTTIVDDARAFLRNCPRTFDLVIFGTLDSQALLGGHSNVRLENFVYTREALEDARKLLAEGGNIGIYYAVFKPWLYQRIYSTVRAAFGDHLQLFRFDDSPFLFNTAIVAGEKINATDEQLANYGTGLESTDDWPFIYLKEPVIGTQYLNLLAMVALLIVAAVFVLRREHSVTGLYAEYLFLGLGFTLMESSAIARMALLFGSTWTVNAVVFASVLLMIFVANWLVLLGMAPSIRLAWAGLFVFLLINVILPVNLLFGLPLILRVLAAALLIGMPVFFAATCFSRLFRKEHVTGFALGINLIGAMGGGLLEYASMATGMRRVWLIAIAVYALAWISATVLRKDR